MANIIGRLSLNPKTWLNGLVATAAVPQRVLADAMTAQRELLETVHAARDGLAASVSGLQLGLRQTRGRLPGLEERARQDLTTGWEDLARFGLQQLQVAEGELDALEQEARKIDRERHGLSQIEERLGVEIDAQVAREEEIVVRVSGDAGHGLLREELGGVPAELAGLLRTLKRLEQRADDLHFRASVVCDLVDLGAPDEASVADDDGPIGDGDESPSSSVERRLMALKREMGMA